MKIDLEQIKFNENGLIPAIVQDHETKEVLILAYMNEESIKMTIKLRQAVFWSRSRSEIWHKGATSGDYLNIKSIALDCDLDAILLLVEMVGDAACHNGTSSCFIDENNNELRAII
ncbi:MAG: phosphoribosyl-AMP cyclohydrolase [Dehalococcoidia bacterium]|nr:phosphoribosyl-AMP cyclohydrolase [Dehalococcoidia bacterium]